MYIVVKNGRVMREGSKSSCVRYAELIDGHVVKVQPQPNHVCPVDAEEPYIYVG